MMLPGPQPGGGNTSGTAVVAHECDLYIDILKKCLCASLYDESAWQSIQVTLDRFRQFESIAFRKDAARVLKENSLDGIGGKFAGEVLLDGPRW
jgi:hypothetical protein